MDAEDIKKIEEIFKHHIGVMSEDFQHKLDLVVEGHQMLNERLEGIETRLDRLETGLERVEIRLDRVEAKVDAVAADVAAHRADTEAHKVVYKVKEGEN